VLSIGAWGVILNPHERMHLIDFLGSSIAAALMYGPVANFANNISIPIFLGMGAGFICTFYKAKLMPKLNRKNLKDSLGILGPFFICPILGTIVVAPVIIFCY
jgi:fructose-specific phosphotransferase system IIC component